MSTAVFRNSPRGTWRARWLDANGRRVTRTFATEAQAREFDPATDTGPRRPGPHSMYLGATPQQRQTRVRDSAVTDENGCWIWQPTGGNHGYGQLMIRRSAGAHQVAVLAHRFSYEAFVGPIPDGLQIDHLCFVPKCVNPEHLEPVTAAENIRRRDARKAVAS